VFLNTRSPNAFVQNAGLPQAAVVESAGNLKANVMTEYQNIAIGILGAAVRAVKFAFAALVAGSRAVPLGDNGHLTRELGAYGERLSH
jgi:hypothetical protein